MESPTSILKGTAPYSIGLMWYIVMFFAFDGKAEARIQNSARTTRTLLIVTVSPRGAALGLLKGVWTK
jgi:hypothetical protein